MHRIEQFLAAVEHGSLTRAAAELDISQPALTKSIRRLERDLGVKLLERGRFGITPTSFGEALAVRGKVMQAEMRNAKSEIDALRGARRGHTLVGCGPTQATRLMSLAATKMIKAGKEIQFTVLYGLSESLIPWVRQGEIDFAVCSVPAFSQDPDLVHETLFKEEGCVVARSGHPLTKREQLSPADLAEFPWVLARRQERERRAIDEFFLSAGFEPPLASIETSSAVLMKSTVMLSDFLSFMPRELIYWEERARQLVPLQVKGLAWSRSVGLTRRRRGLMSPASNALIDMLKSLSGKLSAPT